MHPEREKTLEIEGISPFEDPKANHRMSVEAVARNERPASLHHLDLEIW